MWRSGLLVVALLVVGCTGGDGGDEDAVTTTTEAPTTIVVETTTTTTAPPDPFAVPADPADIDEAYVEAVLTELERINGDALRLAVSEGLSPTITELIRSTYTPDRASTEFDVLVEASTNDFAGILSEPGDVVPLVDRVLVATVRCIGVDAHLDFSAVSDSSAEPLPVRIELRPQEAGAPSNETSWVYAVKTVNDGVEVLADTCVDS